MARVPFTSGFMMTSILGFLISVLFVMDISLTWGFTFALVFVIMFIASIVNMSHIEADDKYSMGLLGIHEEGHYKKNKPKKRK